VSLLLLMAPSAGLCEEPVDRFKAKTPREYSKCKLRTSKYGRVAWSDGIKGSRRALRARAGSSRGRCGCPVLQAPVLAAADSEHRHRPGFRGFLFEVFEALVIVEHKTSRSVPVATHHHN